MCEGVGEDSRHRIGHVDIRVGSCNCLNVFVRHACALRWEVTHVGNYLYWALLTMSRESSFQVQGVCTRTALTRGRDRRKSTCGFDIVV